ncbi:hypothetical protein EPYR_03685 [Erwinia pyrifoliae DSM 12163]|nr:hypothetical protein EPYR_03685 [Erwinia pyrifoliae DSM 12163]
MGLLPGNTPDLAVFSGVFLQPEPSGGRVYEGIFEPAGGFPAVSINGLADRLPLNHCA